jgi:glycosyltransferase involved in cell wall biosynthesis
MRIAYMLTSLGIGGAERQVISIAERMVAREHQVALLVLREQQPNEWPAAIPTFRLGMSKSPIRFVRGVWQAHEILRAFKPDLIHSNTFPANMLARIMRLSGVGWPVLSTIHNICEGGWQRSLAYRVTDRLSCHTTAVSEAVAERSIGERMVPRRKCSVIANGFDLRHFSESPQDSDVERSPRSSDGFIWLAAGRIVQAKDYPNLLRAFAAASVEMSNAELWIAGAGPRQGTDRLLGLAAQLQIDGRVHWLGLRADMRELLCAADGFVLSSAWEGMPLVVGEAMAMKKPVVATDVGGVRGLLGNCGEIVSPHDSPALAEAMLRTMRASRNELRAMGNAARARVGSLFDIDAKVGEWEALYGRLMHAPVSHGSGACLGG